MKKTKNKLISIGFILLLLLLLFVIFILYKNEPKYINNISNENIDKFDFVTVKMYTTSWKSNTVETGIVLQKSNNKFLVKLNDYQYNKYIELDISSNEYRIIGKGTFYHKVNNFVGFNFMFITEIFIIILIIVIIFKIFYNEIFK